MLLLLTPRYRCRLHAAHFRRTAAMLLLPSGGGAYLLWFDSSTVVWKWVNERVYLEEP